MKEPSDIYALGLLEFDWVKWGHIYRLFYGWIVFIYGGFINRGWGSLK